MPKRSKAQKRRVQQKQKRKALNIRRATASSTDTDNFLGEEEFHDFRHHDAPYDSMETIVTAFYDSQNWVDEPEFADPIFELDEAIAIMERADELIAQKRMQTAKPITQEQEEDALVQAVEELLEPHHKEAILAGLDALSERWLSSRKQDDGLKAKMVYISLREMDESANLWGACTLVMALVMRTLSSFESMLTQLDELKAQVPPSDIDDVAGASKFSFIPKVIKNFVGKFIASPKSETDLSVLRSMAEKVIDQSGEEVREAILTGDFELALFTPEELVRQQKRLWELSEPHIEDIRSLADMRDVQALAIGEQITTAFVADTIEVVQQICAVRGEEIKERIRYVSDHTSFTSPYKPYLISLQEDSHDEEWGTPSHHSLNALTKIYIAEGQRYALQAQAEAGELAERNEG